MNPITDIDGNPLTHIALVQLPSAISDVIVIRVECSIGLFLAATDDAHAQVLARRTGSGAAFVDIGATPYDLSPFAGLTITLDVKVQTGAVALPTRVALPIKLTY